ncbi:hypothetical protein KY339_05660 [Candidatus Woesearchaeota archaeon]|nr:hypothetical protein [Candidatus Woesearchaeota archaeon]
MVEDEYFFMKIDEPKGFRKKLLESSRDIIQVLKRGDAVSSVRTEKTKKIMKLKKVIKELKKLALDLEKKLPPVSKKARPSTPMPEKKRFLEAKSPELKDLEVQLGNIQSKLRSLE